MQDSSITPDILRQLLDYDPDTGKLTWKRRGPEWFTDGKQTSEFSAKRWNAKHAGKEAFTADNGKGYRHGSIFNKRHIAHRVVWAIHRGEWPKDQIDHINGNRSDNRIENLRSVTHAENGRNQRLFKTNTSGATGVAWDKRYGKWKAYIYADGRLKHVKYSISKADAIEARKVAERELDFHPNHGGQRDE